MTANESPISRDISAGDIVQQYNEPSSEDELPSVDDYVNQIDSTLENLKKEADQDGSLDTIDDTQGTDQTDDTNVVSSTTNMSTSMDSAVVESTEISNVDEKELNEDELNDSVPSAPSAPFVEQVAASPKSESTDSWNDQYSFLPNDDRSTDDDNSTVESSESKESTGSLSTGNNSTSQDMEDDFRARFMRMNTKDTVRTKKVDVSALDSISESSQLDLEAPKQEPNTSSDTSRSLEIPPLEADTSSEAPSTISRDLGTTDTFEIPQLPPIDLKAIFALPTSYSRIQMLHEKRQELVDCDTGLETYLSESVKRAQPALNDQGIGPHAKAAYQSAQKNHHHYAASVGSVTTEFASDIMRTTSVMKKKGKNLFKKIHFK